MSCVAFGGATEFVVCGAAREGLYKRMDRSEEPVNIYVDGEDEYVRA